MKDFIYINYEIKVDKIYNDYFFVGDEKIIIYKTNKDEKYLNKLFVLSNEMYNNKLYISTFLLNKEGKYYTKKDNDYIILLKVNDRDNIVTLDYLYKFNNFKEELISIDIISEWKEKIDNIESLLLEYNKEHILLQDSVNYFIGSSENAISLLSEYKILPSKDICHDISYLDFRKESFNNPFNLININKLYDISLYIKYNFYNDTLDYDEVYDILIKLESEDDEAFLFSCLLYRNFYFDVATHIINNLVNDEKLRVFIDKIKDYEELLSFCKRYMKKCKFIQLINWIE